MSLEFIGYIADADYAGSDSFSFTASDGTDTSAPVTVSITIEPNQAPTCPASMPFEAEPDMPNQFYPEGCTDDFFWLNFEIAEQPVHGTLEPDPFAGLVYTPDAGYRGPDTFTVTAIDDVGQESDPMVVNVTVLARTAHRRA